MTTDADDALPLAATDADPAMAATERPAATTATDAPVTPGVGATLTEPGTSRARDRRHSGLVGNQLAHYQLEEEIGRGGMGIVYRARDLSLDRQVAVKVLSEAFAGPAGHRERFYREARAQARVNHPNVCHIYYVGEERGQLFFAMELVDGEAVSDLVADDGRLPPARALEIVRQAALGLREAQRFGIVHRDVKPSNLMIDRHGVVKVMDFGIAKQGEAPSDDGSETPSSIEQTTIAGTPLFAAPEQLRGDRIDHRADIYALGATLHQLLTGEAPFVADSVEKLTELHQTESRPRFERRVVGQRDLVLLDELTDRMMAKTPSERFGDYDGLLEAIEFAEPSSSRPAGFGIRALSVAIDGLVVIVANELLGLLIPGLDSGPIVVLMLLLYSLLLLARWGSTVGRWLLGIEVTGGAPGRGLGLHSATRRCIWEFGPITLLAFTTQLGQDFSIDWLVTGGGIGLGGVVLLNVLHVAVSSVRSGAARTFWDRRAHTQVRYLRVRGARASEAR